MSTLKIGTYENKTSFRPGEEAAGRALWILDKPAKAVEMRLFWYTQGKGTVDVRVVDTVRFDGPPQSDQRDFRFTLPAEPYSFSGKLISLVWAVELVVLPSNESERMNITLSPTGREVLLPERTETEGGARGQAGLLAQIGKVLGGRRTR